MGSRVKCELCPTECELSNYQVGGCRVRMNKDGVLYSLVYGRPCSVAIDPIEKKPFFHVLPATKAFSIATVGCVLGCIFCQNWQISQASPEDSDNYDLSPDDLVRQSLYYGCRTIAYTYTEPTVFYEYMYDTSAMAGKFGVKNTMHTCGYINEKPLRALSKYMDAACVDLKAFTEGFYAKLCGGRLKPVLDSLVVLRDEGVWIEITNLIIPTHNDDLREISDMCTWIVRNLGPDVPIHFSRFFPHYKLKNLPHPWRRYKRPGRLPAGQGSGMFTSAIYEVMQRIPSAHNAGNSSSRGSVTWCGRTISPEGDAPPAVQKSPVFGRHDMTRRDFFRLFVLGGIFGIVGKKLKLKNKPKRAMFWRKKT